MRVMHRSAGGRSLTALVVSCLFASQAGAATFTVTNGNDAGAGSLRDAVAQANGSMGPDIIQFDAAVTTVGISGGEIDVSGDLNLTGPGRASLRIERSAGTGRLLDLGNGTNVTISGVTLDGNDTPSGLDGGCVFAESSNLVLQDVHMTACSALTAVNPEFNGRDGGALYFDGRPDAGCTGGICSLRIEDSLFDGNTALNAGGAVYAIIRDGSGLVVQDSQFTDNVAIQSSPGGFRPSFGGGFALISLFQAGAASFSGCSFSNNTLGSAGALFDPGIGGGLGVQYDGNDGSAPQVSLTISDCSVTGNRAGEGGGGGIALFNDQLPLKSTAAPKTLTFPVLIERTTVSGNSVDGIGRGGGIYLNDISPMLRKGAPASTFTLDSSTLSNNIASEGGGLAVVGSYGTLQLRNSTVSGNSSSSAGSGLRLGGNGTVALEHSTIAGNVSSATGAGVELVVPNTTLLRIQNSILDDNTDSGVARDIAVAGSVTFDLDYSLINAAPGAGSDFDNAVTAGSGMLRDVSAQLGLLSLNGGPTATRVPMSGSPVINAGDPAFTGASLPSTDQRGTGFPRFAGGRLDMGAVETTPAVPVLAATKTVAGTFLPEETFVYTIIISNSGTGAQPDNPGDEFTDVLPAGLTLNAASATSGTAVATVGTRTVTWNGAIPASGSVTISITATINAGTAGETLSNQGSIAFDADANGSNESTLLTDDPEVAGAANPTSFVVLNPGVLAFEPASYSVNENAGSGNVSLTVTRSGGSAGAASVNYTTVAGTATAGSDYTTSSATLNWADGDATPRSIVVPIINDSEVEANEQFTVVLSNASGASLGAASTATVTIVSEDVAPAGTLGFALTAVSVNEDAGTATLSVTRTGGSSGAVGATCATQAGGSATAGGDYTSTSTVLGWADGDTAAKSCVIPILDDNVVESDETVLVTLSAPTGGAGIGAGSATVTILDEDNAGSVAFGAASYTISEPTGAPAAKNVLTVTVLRSGGSDGAVSVDVATADGTAVAPGDYTPRSTTLSWADGVAGALSVQVTINPDSLVEPAETFSIGLSNPQGGVVLGTPSSATITIPANGTAIAPAAIIPVDDPRALLLLVAAVGLIAGGALRRQRYRRT
jgi:uncharacterized repeat protein (TIGR01451 family)